MNITLLSQMRVFLDKTGLAKAAVISLAALLFTAPASAAELPYSATPLFWSAGVEPNVALMIDTSGSMSNAGSHDTGASYPYVSNCDGATVNQPGTYTDITRLEAAKQAACQVATDNATSMRIGVYRFNNGGNAGERTLAIGTNTATTIKGAILPLTGQNGTPLTSAMDTIVRDYAGATSPIQYRCQKNYAVFFTDGDPSTGYDTNATYTFPSLDTKQYSSWQNSTAASGDAVGSPSWDGFTDPKYNPGAGSDVYAWLDDLTQFAYDVDFKTGASPAPTTALCGFSITGVAGKDCSGKSWQGTDDATPKLQKQFEKQNIVTYTLGFGDAAKNGLMLNAPLVNKVPIVPANVNITDNTINIANHGLADGQFVHYYASMVTSSHSTAATADTSAETLGSADTTNMPNGALLTYNNGGGASLEYETAAAIPPVPAITCADANATMGLTSGNSYYVSRIDSDTMRLATSAANADLCNNYSNGNGNVATYCINLLDRSLNSLVHTFTKAAVPGTPFIPGTPDIPATPPAPVVPALAPQMSLVSPYPVASINPGNDIERLGISAHGLTTGQRVVYTCTVASSGAACGTTSSGLIGGLSVNGQYFAAVTGPNTFRLATTAARAALCDDYADGAGNVSNYCIDISNPTSGSTTTVRNHRFTAYTEGTPFIAGTPDTPAVAAIPAVVASFTADGTGSSPIDQNALTETLNFPSNHNLSTQDLVTYTCSGGTPMVPGVPAVTASRSTYYARNVSSGNPGTFELSLTLGGPRVDIAIAGSGSQTFSWTSSVAQNVIDDLEPYKTDGEALANPDPSAQDEAKGKYYVELVDADSFKLRQCGSNVDCTNEGAIVDLTSTGYGYLSTGPGSSYFASTAAELSAQLADAFKAIADNTLSFSAVAMSSEQAAGSKVYQATFSTGNWSGEVIALDIDPVTRNVIKTPPAWLASKKVPAPYTSRNVFTWNGTVGVDINNDLNTLTAAQQGSFGPVVADRQKVLSWVLGKDDPTGLVGSRTRKKISPVIAGYMDINVYGDVLSGSPNYVGTPVQNYDINLPTGTPGKSTYLAYKGITRTPMLYVGANDGMLHGIDAATGEEKMAFIPNGVFTDFTDLGDNTTQADGEVLIRKFYELSREDYGQIAAWPHRFFVDAAPASGDAYFTGAKAGIAAGNWHTVLVGGLGKGGRTIYALDVTDPANFGVNNVLWEFGPGTGGKMGYTYGKPVITRLQTGDWAAIFSNGYDGNGDIGRLFIVNLETGLQIDRMDAGTAGLSSVSVLKDINDTAVAVYAGDLAGNVWKFDISDSNSGNWADPAAPFFVAEDSTGSNSQAITTSITLGPISPSATCAAGKTCAMLYFGTGSYFQDGDKTYEPLTNVPKDDTFYALLDNGAGNIVGKTNLVEQTIGTTTVGGVTYRTSSQNPVDYTGTARGWYMNLVVGGNFQGERVIYRPAVAAGLVFFSTVIPSGSDPCASNASSWLMILNSLDGNMRGPLFDTNNDGAITSDDPLVSGLPSPGGLIGEIQANVVTSTVPAPSGTGTATQTDVEITYNTSGDAVADVDPDVIKKKVMADLKLDPPPPGAYPGGRMSWRQLQ